jgi:hypothetical protein
LRCEHEKFYSSLFDFAAKLRIFVETKKYKPI